MAAFALGRGISVSGGGVMSRQDSHKFDRESMRAALATMLYERDAGDSTPAAIGRRLAHVRDCAGIKQTALARRLGTTYGSWCNYERGRMAPNASTLTALYRLGINPAWVLTGAGSVLVDDVSEDFSLAQANGWGSAGECPASSSTKTPAAGAQCFRVAGVGTWHGDGAISLCVSLQRPGGGVE